MCYLCSDVAEVKSLIDVKDPLVMAEAGALQQRLTPLSHAGSIMSPKVITSQVLVATIISSHYFMITTNSFYAYYSIVVIETGS